MLDTMVKTRNAATGPVRAITMSATGTATAPARQAAARGSSTRAMAAKPAVRSTGIHALPSAATKSTARPAVRSKVTAMKATSANRPAVAAAAGKITAVKRMAEKSGARKVTELTIATARAGAQESARIARRDSVVLEHLPLVKAIAVRVHENLPVHVDVDDLVHAGILGLFDAASKFNPDKQVAFSSYAKHRIKGAILDSLRQLDWASRDMRRRHKQVESATRELASTLQRNPTESEVAAKLGIDPERWRTMMIDLRNVGLVSASTRANENEDLPAPDFPSGPETQPDSMCAHEQLRSTLGVAMKTLPERYQKVVSLYYSNEMTMKEIGTVLGINESRVSQIHKAALEKMQVALEAHGIRSPQAF